MADDFNEGMLDIQEDINKRWSKECARLRKQVADLKRELAERDPDLWALSEELQAARLQIESLKRHSDAGGKPQSGSEDG